MTQIETKVEQLTQKLFENKGKIKFKDLHVLLTEGQQEILQLILAKYALNEEGLVCPECHAAARKIQQGALVFNFEDQEIVLNKRGKYLQEKHMTKNIDLIARRVTNKKCSAILKEMRESMSKK